MESGIPIAREIHDGVASHRNAATNTNPLEHAQFRDLDRRKVGKTHARTSLTGLQRFDHGIRRDRAHVVCRSASRL